MYLHVPRIDIVLDDVFPLLDCPQSLIHFRGTFIEPEKPVSDPHVLSDPHWIDLSPQELSELDARGVDPLSLLRVLLVRIERLNNDLRHLSGQLE